MKRILSAVALCLLSAGVTCADNLRFATNPSLSPDGSSIYFAYQGGLYCVATSGGQALSLLSMRGQADYPVVSPDGRYLAFSSDINGNLDVFVIPVGGGEVRQLTFHEANDFPTSWSPDSRYIYFESNREVASRTTWRVAVEGGTPQRLFPGYFTTVVNLVENPVNGEFYFNESGESIYYATRKHYIGDHNADVLAWNPAKGAYRSITNYIGKDAWPMVDSKGNLYYVSDEACREDNIVKWLGDGKTQQLTSFNHSLQYPKIAFDGSAIVYLLDYQIHVLDPKSGEDSVPQITLAGGNLDVQRAFEKQKPEDAAVSPDGKKMAFVIRGLLYVSDAEAKYLQRMPTPLDERVSEVKWASDSKTLIYLRTNKGWYNLYKLNADLSGSEEVLFAPDRTLNNLEVSPDGKKFAFIDGTNSLMIHDFGKNVTEKVADAEFWPFIPITTSFSYDGRYLAFEAISRFEYDIYLYDLKEKTVSNLTNSAVSEEGAVFTPDGKYLYFTTSGTETSFPRGADMHLVKLPLRKFDSKFKSSHFTGLFKKDEKAAGDSAVVIDFKDVHRRVQPVLTSGYQTGLFVFPAKSKLFFNQYRTREVFALDLNDEKAQPKPVKGLKPGKFFASKDALYCLSSDGTVSKVDPDGLTAKPIEVAVDVRKQLGDEFRQMFYENWSTLAQNYYDVNFHGADWNEVRTRYESFLPYLHTRQQLRIMLNDMLGELNSSHLRFVSSGSEEKTETTLSSACTGLIFSEKEPYKVESVLPWSPADRVGVDVKKGDVLVAVDGVKVNPKANREQYFASAVKRDEVRLTLNRGGKEHEALIHTATSRQISNLQYLAWEDECRERVDKASNGRVAYIHMRALGSEDLNDFLTKMHTDAANRDALILDLRYNNGGNVHKEVIDFLRQKQHFRWSFRDFPAVSHPNVTPADKPIVVLVNEHSLSDAEVTSNAITTLGIAPIVGTETYRWIIFTGGVELVDGSYTRLPAWGCYNLKGDDLEFSGVKPDVYVRNTFEDRVKGRDPQLDTAIKMILEKLSE